MGFATFVIKTVLAIDVILIGYGQAQRYGNPNGFDFVFIIIELKF